jgi:hypothetical protein
VPSDSLACAGYADAPAPLQGAHMKFENNFPEVEGVMGAIPAEIPARGYAAFALGGTGAECFCGWQTVRPGVCMMPPAVCLALRDRTSPTAPECEFPAADPDGSVAAEFIAAWQPGAWPCPEMDFSDAWGIATDLEADRWIGMGNNPGNITMRITDLLASGRAGMRVGNADTIGNQVCSPTTLVFKRPTINTWNFNGYVHGVLDQ